MSNAVQREAHLDNDAKTYLQSISLPTLHSSQSLHAHSCRHFQDTLVFLPWQTPTRPSYSMLAPN